MPGDPDPQYVRARSTLLDATDALAAHPWARPSSSEGLPGNVSAPALHGRLLTFAAPESDWGERPRRDGSPRVEGGHES